MRRFRILAPLVVLFACKGGDGTSPDDIPARVQVVPGQVTLTSVGARQQFAAQIFDDAGDPLTGAVSWRSSDETVLKVDANGLATATAEGEAAVLAEAGSATGRADVSVDVPDCTAPQTVHLPAGGVLVTDPPTRTSCALVLPSGASGDRYRVAIVRVLPTQDGTATDVALNASPLGAVVAPPRQLVAPAQPPALDARALAALAEAATIADATERAHARLRGGEADLLRQLGPLHPASLVLPGGGPKALSPGRRTFQPRLPSDIQCSPAPAPVPAVLVAQNADVAIYQDSAQALASPVDPAYAQRMLDFFAQVGRSTIEPYFGPIPDRDGNGQVVVLADSVRVSGGIAAFVWGGDQLPKADCPASNEMELVYFSSSLINAIGRGQHQALETLVHEVKHVVSFHERVVGHSFTTQPNWIEEGTAEIAGEVASRRAWAAAGGPAATAMINAQSFGVPARLTPENFGVYLRLFRTVQYLTAQPNSLTFATSAAYSIYGSGWHFHRFLGDAYGSAATGAEAPLFLQQNRAATTAGLPGIKAITGRSFAELMTDFAAAMMLNGTGAPAPARPFTTYDFPSATSIVQGRPAAPYPYVLTSGSFAARSWSGQIGNSGIVIHEFTSSGTGTGTEITVRAEAPARVVVTRLR